MLDTQMQPHRFNLEGTLVSFLGSDPRKPKLIAIEVEQEQLAIQLPKELRPYVRSYLRPGDRVRCIGCTQVDFKAGVIKLKAYQVFALPPCPQEESMPPACLPTGLPCEQMTRVEPLPKATKSAKILVCHKSGCQRRGGREVVVALETALKNHQLHDQVEIHYTGCQKRCSKSPSLTIMPGKHRYDCLNVKNISALIEEHFCTS